MSSRNNNTINNLPRVIRPAAKFVRHQEQAAGLSTSRFIQDVTTCLVPKVVFSRSKEDLAENAFLEVSEETLIYFVPAILGQRVARSIFSSTTLAMPQKGDTITLNSADDANFSQYTFKVLSTSGSVAKLLFLNMKRSKVQNIH